MIYFHDGHLYRTRAVLTWGELRGADTFRDDYRDFDAAYCLDALQEQPAGGTWRIEPRDAEPFAAPLHACGRY